MFETALASFTIVNIDIVPALGLECWTPVDYIESMVVTTVFPIVVALLLWMTYAVFSVFGPSRTLEEKAQRFGSYCCTYLLLSPTNSSPSYLTNYHRALFFQTRFLSGPTSS
jgi:hypothetical protein